MLEVVGEIEAHGAGIVSLAASAIDTTNATRKLVFGVFSGVGNSSATACANGRTKDSREQRQMELD